MPSLARTTCSILLLLASVAWAADPAWEVAAQDDGVTVYTRPHPGSNLEEMKAVGVINASPQEVWTTIRDYPHYNDTMPYTEESRVLASEDHGKVTIFYSVVNAPLVSRRDYLIRLLDVSDWRNGQGYLKVEWHATDKGPAPQPGIVRVTVNDGYWLLQPQDGGRKTLATYFVFTDPGGSIPNWIANRANGTAVPNVFRAIRRTTAQREARR